MKAQVSTETSGVAEKKKKKSSNLFKSMRAKEKGKKKHVTNRLNMLYNYNVDSQKDRKEKRLQVTVHEYDKGFKHPASRQNPKTSPCHLHEIVTNWTMPSNCISEDCSCLAPGTPCQSGSQSFSSNQQAL